jgi:hypothetical protein
MISFKTIVRKLCLFKYRHRIEHALALQRRGEVRSDGLTLTAVSHHLEIEWCARYIHPWDRGCDRREQEDRFAEQSFADTDAALSRLFNALPDVDVIEFRVLHPDSHQRILAGTVGRTTCVTRTLKVSSRTRLWHRGVAISLVLLAALSLLSKAIHAQASATSPNSDTDASSTSTDYFVMIGSDFDRPGLLPRANYNIGVGHTFEFLKKDPLGDELTFGYTYENSGTHGFFHTNNGEHTESAGVMKNFALPKTKVLTGYTWLQSGITSYTGNAQVQNRLDSGVSLGGIVHFNNNHSVWIQESYSKVVTVPWYTTFSIGYTYSR